MVGQTCTIRITSQARGRGARFTPFKAATATGVNSPRNVPLQRKSAKDPRQITLGFFVTNAAGERSTTTKTIDVWG